jgi:hypothetical protein
VSSMDAIEKHSTPLMNYTVRQAAALADAKPIPFGSMSTGMVYNRAGSTITALTFYAAPTKDGTYVAAKTYDDTAVALTSIAASEAREFPPGVYPIIWMKIIGDADGVIDLTLKA